MSGYFREFSGSAQVNTRHRHPAAGGATSGIPEAVAAETGAHAIIPRMSKKKKSGADDRSIAVNKKARHDYFIEEQVEAGIVLEGWEVKSLREKRVQLNESYVLVKEGEIWLFGAHVAPLPTASTHISPDPVRTRKLLLHRKEIANLIGTVERKGYTLVPLSLYWKHGRAKLEVGLARGKKQYDKRQTEKERDWNRDRQRLLKAL